MKAGKKKGKAGRKRQGSMEGARPPGGRGGRGAAGQDGTLPAVAGGRKYTLPKSYEVKRRAVQLYLEEGVPGDLVSREVGVRNSTIFKWVQQYRENGEEGLHPQSRGHRTINGPLTSSKPTPRALIRAEITALKRKHPTFGIKRISQTLRRIFHLSASPETVRKTLHREKLIKPKKKKTPSNPSKPRRSVTSAAAPMQRSLWAKVAGRCASKGSSARTRCWAFAASAAHRGSRSPGAWPLRHSAL